MPIRAVSRSSDFIIGLTDVSPTVRTPTLCDYDVCGQWPGVVGLGVTVYLRCADNLPPRRYVIVQLPRAETLNFSELQVFVRRTYLHCAPKKVALSISLWFLRTLTDFYTASMIGTSYNKSIILQHSNVDLPVVPTYCYISEAHVVQLLAVWLSGNTLASINVVALRQTRLVLGWVTVCGRVNHLGM